MSYLVAGADVHASLQELQDLVQVSSSGGSQEAGVAVRLQETQTKKSWLVSKRRPGTRDQEPVLLRDHPGPAQELLEDTQDQKLGQFSDRSARTMVVRVRRPGPRDQTPETRNQKPETMNQQPGPKDQKPGTRGQKPGTKNQDPGGRPQDQPGSS